MEKPSPGHIPCTEFKRSLAHSPMRRCSPGGHLIQPLGDDCLSRPLFPTPTPPATPSVLPAPMGQEGCPLTWPFPDWLVLSTPNSWPPTLHHSSSPTGALQRRLVLPQNVCSPFGRPQLSLRSGCTSQPPAVRIPGGM